MSKKERLERKLEVHKKTSLLYSSEGIKVSISRNEPASTRFQLIGDSGL